MPNREDKGSVTLKKLTPLNGDHNLNDHNKDNGQCVDDGPVVSNGNSNGKAYVSDVPAVKYELGNENNTKQKDNGLFGCCGKKDSKPEDDRVGVFELFTFASTMDRMLMVIGLFGSVVLGCTIPINMAVFGDVINTFITANDTKGENGTSKYDNIVEEMMPHIYFFLGIAVAALISGYVAIFCFQWTAERQVNKMRIKFFNSVMKQNIGWFDVHEAGEIGSHFSEDISKIGDGIGDKLAVFVQWTSTWAAAYVMAFTRSWQLTLCIALFSPAIVFLGGIILKVLRNFSIKEFKAYAKAGAVADQAFRAIRTVQAFQGQEKEAERYNTNLTHAVNVASRKGIALGMGQSALWFMIFLLFGTIMWLGVVFIQQLDVPPGNVIPVFLGVMIGSVALGNASNNLENFSTARGAASKVFSMIALVPDIDGTSEGGYKPKEFKGHLKLENIHFSYPARPGVKVLNGFNLEIEPGKHIALVGSSGCGKSTVVQLVQRFYDPHDGKIFFDGQDLKNINLKWLRKKIGIVSQEPVLFDMSIADNIKFGKLDASQKEIEQAAMDANAHDFIKLLPQGYETNVGERGAQLSGGQKQRIAIARALIRNPNLLLLDEATSALDQESEAIVQNALNKAKKGRTTITIAHRLSTIKNADLIVSISEGQLLEMGTHDQLMESRGLYFELVQMQTRLEKEGELDLEENIGHLSLHPAQSLSPTRDVEIIEEDDEEHDATQGLLRASFRRTDSVESKNSGKQMNLVARTSQRSNIKKEMKIKKEMLEEENVKEVALKTIFQFNAPEWHLILFGSLASLLGGSLHPCFSFLLSEFIKVLSEEDEEKQMSQTHLLAGIVIGIAVFSGCIRMAQGFCFCKSGVKLTARLRSLTFESLINQDMEYFDQPQNQVGSLTTKLASDAALVQGATGSKIGQVLEALSCLICAVVIAFAFGWKLAFVVCAFLPFMIAAGIVRGYVIRGASKKDNKQLQEAGKICSEVIDNIRTVVSLGREDYFFSRFETLINMNKKSNLKTSMVFGVCYGIASSLIFFAYATAFYYGSMLVEKGEMEFFNVFRVFAAIIFGGTMVGRQSSFGVDYAKAKMAASRIISLINRKPKVDVREQTGDKMKEFEGGLTVQGAVFHYPMRPTIPVLNGMDLSIKPGETVALVGASGCGKSTVTQILQRFYELDGGSVFADSLDIRKVNLTWFRQQISIVSQEPTLFDCSIAENIAYGDNTRVVPMDEIIQAAKDANIHTFVSSLPQGYDTNVGNKGTQLSGGQKQRIAIARALVRNPKILLLDEATSALDSESEKIVQEALDKAGVNRTCVIIAHRLSTIQNADRIAVVNKGKIVEIGSHAKLMTIKGAYYRLYSAQNRIVGIQ